MATDLRLRQEEIVAERLTSAGCWTNAFEHACTDARFCRVCAIGIGADWSFISWRGLFQLWTGSGSYRPQGKSDENNARCTAALRRDAKRSRRRIRLPHHQKREPATRVLRRSVNCKNRKAGGGCDRCAASIQGPVCRGRRPNHRQAKEYLSRLLTYGYRIRLATVVPINKVRCDE